MSGIYYVFHVARSQSDGPSDAYGVQLATVDHAAHRAGADAERGGRFRDGYELCIADGCCQRDEFGCIRRDDDRPSWNGRRAAVTDFVGGIFLGFNWGRSACHARTVH